MKLTQEQRRLWWLNHGCPSYALYGDDGEMQCGNCCIDFKRFSAENILEKLLHHLALREKERWKEVIEAAKELP